MGLFLAVVTRDVGVVKADVGPVFALFSFEFGLRRVKGCKGRLSWLRIHSKKFGFGRWYRWYRPGHYVVRVRCRLEVW